MTFLAHLPDWTGAAFFAASLVLILALMSWEDSRKDDEQ